MKFIVKHPGLKFIDFAKVCILGPNIIFSLYTYWKNERKHKCMGTDHTASRELCRFSHVKEAEQEWKSGQFSGRSKSGGVLQGDNC